MSDRLVAGRTGEGWTQAENEATVDAYVKMLAMEVRGETYKKTDVVRGLMAQLPARSQAPIGQKLRNVSAVREEMHWAWVDGYKPLTHYQRALREAVVARSGPRALTSERTTEYGDSKLISPQATQRATSDVMVETPHPAGSRTHSRSSVSLTGGHWQALSGFQRQALGAAGEEWDLGLEPKVFLGIPL